MFTRLKVSLTIYKQIHNVHYSSKPWELQKNKLLHICFRLQKHIHAVEPRRCRPAGPSLIQSHEIFLLISETETAVFVSLACVELQCNQTPKQQEANTNRWLEIEVVSQ